MTRRRLAAAAMLAFAVAVLLTFPFAARAQQPSTLSFKFDTATHAVTFDYNDFWLLTRPPDVIHAPRGASYVSVRTSTGTVWTIAADGTIYADGVPVTSSANAMSWQTQGFDFETVTLAAPATCRYGIAGAYANLNLAAGTYNVTPGAFGVADPALGTRKSLDCQVLGGVAKASQLTIVGAQVYAKFDAVWRRYVSGGWADASSTPADLLDAPADPAAATQ